MMEDESEVAMGLLASVVFEETGDPKIVMPRWRISGTPRTPGSSASR